MATYRVTAQATGTGTVDLALSGVSQGVLAAPGSLVWTIDVSGAQALRFTAAGDVVWIGDGVLVELLTPSCAVSDSAGAADALAFVLAVPSADERTASDSAASVDALLLLQGLPAEIVVPFGLSIAIDAIAMAGESTSTYDSARSGDVVALGIVRVGPQTDNARAGDAVTFRVLLGEEREGRLSDTAYAGDALGVRRGGLMCTMPGPKPFRYWKDADLNALRDAIQQILDYLNSGGGS